MEFDSEAAVWLAPALGAVAGWIDAHKTLVTRVFAEFQATGCWPDLNQFQRKLDHELGTAAPQVHQVWNEAPRGTAYINSGDNTTRAALQVRVLTRLAEAALLVDKFVAVVRLALERYQQQQDVLESDEIAQVVGLTKEELALVATLLFHEWPLQVNRNVREDGRWAWHLDPGNRRFMGLQDIEQFLDIQARLMYRPSPSPQFAGRTPLFPDVGETTPTDQDVIAAAGQESTPPATALTPKTGRNWSAGLGGTGAAIVAAVSGVVELKPNPSLGIGLLAGGALLLVGAVTGWRKL